MISLEPLRHRASNFLSQPILGILLKTKINPNTLTIMGFIGNLVAASLIACGYLFWGGILILISGLFDLWDGSLAKVTKRTTFGAILDSTLDRLSEAILLLALLWRFWDTIILWVIFAALVGSFLVSYIRARGEGVGLPCPVGFFTRAERIVILSLGLLLGQVFICLMIIAVLSWLTAGQRFFYLWRKAKI
jgi:phosphatidylglycerophosphate synthase